MNMRNFLLPFLLLVSLTRLSAQPCTVQFQTDSLTSCLFSDTLVVYPPGGSWDLICTPGLTDYAVLSPNAAGDSLHLEVASCGTYDLSYTYLEVDSTLLLDSIFLDTVLIGVDTLLQLDTLCLAIDTTTITFKDVRGSTVQQGASMKVHYEEPLPCEEEGTIYCGGSWTFEGEAPQALWDFRTEGCCGSFDYEVSVVDPDPFTCQAGDLEVQTFTTEECAADSLLNIPQEDLMVGGDGSGVWSAFQQFTGQFGNYLGDLCGPVAGECPDSLEGCLIEELDTLLVEIPYIAGGQWHLVEEPGGALLPLADTGVVNYQDSTLLIQFDPGATVYNSTVSVLHLSSAGDTLPPNFLDQLEFQWVVDWAVDTIYVPVIDITLDPACAADVLVCFPDFSFPPIMENDFQNSPLDSVPCPSVNITFDWEPDAEVTVIDCDETGYQIEVVFTQGIPPFSVNGVAGTMVSDSLFVSDWLPYSHPTSAVVQDATECDGTIEWDYCGCIGLSASTNPLSTGYLLCNDSCLTLTGSASVGLDFPLVISWTNEAVTPSVTVFENSIEACEAGTYVFSAEQPATGCVVEREVEIFQSSLSANSGFGTITCITPAVELMVTVNEVAPPWAAGPDYFWTGPGLMGTSTDPAPVVNVPGVYQLILENDMTQCSDVVAFVVDLDTLPPEAEAGPEQILPCAGTTVTLEGAGTGAVNWEGPGINAGNANSLQPVVDQPGIYSLTLTDPFNGCSAGDSVEVTQGSLTLDLSQPIPLDCEVLSVQLEATVVTTLPGPFIYEWSGPGITPSNQNNPAPVVGEPGNYNLTVTYQEGPWTCTASATVVVSSNQVGIVASTSQSETQLPCNGESITLSSAGSTFGPGITLEWSGPGIDGSNQNQSNPTVDTPGWYSLLVLDADNGCEDLDSVLVQELALDLEPQVSGVLTCMDPVAQLSVEELSSAEPPYTYLWSGPDIDPSGEEMPTQEVTVAGTYFVEVTHPASGCSSVAEIQVQADQTPPQLAAFQDSELGCGADSTQLLVSVDGATFWSAQWTGPGILSDPTATGIWVSEPGLYQVLVTNLDNGCTRADSILVAPAPPLALEVLLTPPCGEEWSGSLEVLPLEGTAPFTYTLNELLVQDEPLFTELPAATYTLEVVDAEGCTGMTTVELDVFPAVELDLEEQYEICGEEGLALQLDLPVDSSLVELSWSDGQEGTLFETTEPGTYFLDLTTPCQSDTYSFEVVDLSFSSEVIQVPNIFTPDGDGRNDQFRVLHDVPIDAFEFRIFNRWGEEVFSTSDPDRGWDGRRNDRNYPMDTYVWKLYAEYESCEGQEVLETHGQVTLIR